MRKIVLLFTAVLFSLSPAAVTAGDRPVLSTDGPPLAVSPAPEKGLAPGAGPVLVDQPGSVVDPNAYISQDFETVNDYADSFAADDFEASTAWMIGRIFVPGTATTTNLACANTLNWQIYRDNGGVPDGDPRGGGNPPLWSISLPPTDPQVVLSDTFLDDVTLTLDKPVKKIPAGTYWLVFYPHMDFLTCGQWFWRPSDSTNGAIAQVINPEGGLLPTATAWSPTNGTLAGFTLQDMAFRIEGAAQPAFGLDVKANFDDGPVTTPAGGRNILTVSLDPKGAAGTPAEYWVIATTPFGLFSYRVGQGWGPGEAVAHQGVLGSLPPFIVYDGKIPKGKFSIYFIVDLIVNGMIDVGGGNGFFDRVKLTVQ